MEKAKVNLDTKAAERVAQLEEPQKDTDTKAAEPETMGTAKAALEATATELNMLRVAEVVQRNPNLLLTIYA